jgi:hypothetical protein
MLLYVRNILLDGLPFLSGKGEKYIVDVFVHPGPFPITQYFFRNSIVLIQGGIDLIQLGFFLFQIIPS